MHKDIPHNKEFSSVQFSCSVMSDSLQPPKPPQFKSINFSALSFLYSPTLTYYLPPKIYGAEVVKPWFSRPWVKDFKWATLKWWHILVCITSTLKCLFLYTAYQLSSSQAQLLGKEQLNEKFSLVSFNQILFFFFFAGWKEKKNAFLFSAKSSICIWMYSYGYNK